MMLSTSDSITVNNLEKKFGQFVAVNKITFSVKKGEIFGFLGGNGSGKSTTIRMLCGIITPTSGSGSVAGSAGSSILLRSINALSSIML